jgi:glycogen debranching enzyme
MFLCTQNGKTIQRLLSTALRTVFSILASMHTDPGWVKYRRSWSFVLLFSALFLTRSYRSPLVEPYFTRVDPPSGKLDPLTYSLANNGWIWNADPLANFAQLPSKAYLRREVIVWGDCVKLRYGEGPQDNPWLWQHMTNYVTSLASIFDGFRIDNCHSTPLVVGTGMLDKAREENPDLYVCAELFTGSEEMDLLFVKKLGVNSLIRESGNGYDPKELSRLLYRHGVGKPIGEYKFSVHTVC